MNFLVCTVVVIGSLVSGHTIRYKREIFQEPAHENQIQQSVEQTLQIENLNYENGGQAAYDAGNLDQNQGSVEEGRISHVTLTKEIPIQQPIPVPVPVEKKIPRPIFVDVPVPIDQPYYVKIHRPYPVAVYKDIPYTVYKDIPIPVKVAIEVPYPVKVPVLVPHPIPIEIDIPVKVPYADLKVIKKPVVLEHQEVENGGSNVIGGIGGTSGVELNEESAVIGHGDGGHGDQTIAQSVQQDNDVNSDGGAANIETNADKQT